MRYEDRAREGKLPVTMILIVVVVIIVILAIMKIG